ncbi:hypothetical protein C1H46_005607 [Malus baccata]|uniref:non-specific serine/threonine protein kinase n=1 Tax=Malus baccata TaxID=106549 RepID=A0A540NCI8_MALBA|nr:hypothetical protein C1H46_005607 [Malus baccata]
MEDFGEPEAMEHNGDPCSGAAVDSSDFTNKYHNPFIKCDCSYEVYAMDVVGVIPDELWTLTFLFNLNLGQNYLTGPLSSSIGNLTSKLYLSLGINGLSGELPKELGNLTDLISFAFGANNFSGPLPSELGSLSKLKEIYFDSSGVSGEIPSTFANLQNLKTLIADFIGNWPKLSVLRLQGNSFEGPIPVTFYNLTSLTELRISDLSNANGSSTLGFIKDMKSLSILVLRNNNISDSIPSNIGEYQSLSQLDLSFNNLTGQIPDLLFNLSSLSILDLSYNFLLGSFPSWVNEENLQLVLPSGLNCLQRNFPCNRGCGIYYNFGIMWRSLDYIFRWDCTARLYALSLRYYGLGLENGNYTVSLEFAETAILDSTTWKSLGRQVFDIYTQGNLFSRDFDIRKEAGASFQAIQKEFKVQVSENYLEIHLFWAGKGTCCIPGQRTYGPAISAISATPDFIPTVSNGAPASKKNRTWLIVGIVVGGRILVLGGTLNDGRVIGVKQWSAASHQGKNQFVTEIATISAVQHNNLVNLYGFCIEGDKRLLVYEYLENKSLDQALFGKRSLNLNWSERFDICLGVARGLTYLHEESRLRIVHRDVKASNILLDSNLIPKISDFGLAKLYDDKKTHISTRVAGTIGYLAPEYAMRGHLTEKTDVFAFGVVALEIVSGRPNSDPSLEEDKIYLLEWAWYLHENKREAELVDSRLSEFNKEEAKRIINIGLLCTQTSPLLRPSMSRVVGMLSVDIEVATATSKPGYLTDWKFDDVSSVTSLTIDVSAKGTDSTFYNSSASTTMMGDTRQPPAMAGENLGKGIE